MMRGMAVKDEPSQTKSPLAEAAIGLLLATAMIFCLGIGVGMTMAHIDKGGGISAKFALLMAADAALLVVLGYALARHVRKMRAATGPLTRRETLNRNILIACGLLGGVIALVLVLASGGENFAAFSDAPLPPAIAITLALVTGIAVPALSYYWQKHASDEQEIDAYEKGTVAGFYLYAIGAPTWWLLWRGGLLPEPNGILIYFATIFLVGIVWMRRKHS